MATTALKPCTGSFCFLLEEERDEEMAKLVELVCDVVDVSLCFLAVETAREQEAETTGRRGRRRCYGGLK
jgi:hypothetical protein